MALHTLGCKVNQYETQKMAEGFRSRGFDLVDFSEQADVYVINTCTVTHTADSKSRQAARSAIHRNPEAKVIVTGCYAETSPDDAQKIEGVCIVAGNNEKAGLADRVAGLLGDASVPTTDQIRAAYGRHPAEGVDNPQSSFAKAAEDKSAIRNRTRALLKVQDGCDQFCSYCAVPLARSNMSSKPFAEAVGEASDLAGKGYKEIVLTGIRLGRYGDGEKDLADLLEAISEIEGIERIRLSSIELTDMPDELSDLMAKNPKVCRHLHIPLQSGDDRVLARMNRPYTASEFAEFVRNARARVPGVAITTDIMVGFPGETEEEFENTRRFTREMQFSRAHIFRFSPRRGTAAAEMPNPVSAAEKDRRSELLISLASESSREFTESLVGKTVSVLVEGKRPGGRMRTGLTDNYVRVAFEVDAHLAGEIVKVEIDSVSQGTALGKLIVE